MRQTASILHLDLDAFFASVEQRDKPSLRGKPVIVGGLGGRGVVSTASYEARVYGVHSAMPMHEARRLCPRAAFLSGRFGAYRAASRLVMGVLAEVSPLVEPVSLDEAYVDLAAGTVDVTDTEALLALARSVRERVADVTGGLTASVGLGSSKFMAKLASEIAKPDGIHLVLPGTEVDHIAPLAVRAIPGVGPVTAEKLDRLGIQTVEDLRRASPNELRREVGQAWATELARLAVADDDRPVSAEREVKSISVEDTFDADISDLAVLEAKLSRDALGVAERLRRAGLFARTVTVKIKLGDFTTHTRSRTLLGAVDDGEVIAESARQLLRGASAQVAQGVRLLGVGVSSFTGAAQEALFEVASSSPDELQVDTVAPTVRHGVPGYQPGEDVIHDVYGAGWVWGSGHGWVTVRFETALSEKPGPVRAFRIGDPALRPTAQAGAVEDVSEPNEEASYST
ncbi:MAG TPA: DNA polymerase IV [Propionibacteriaceae bacterium]|nr:DNA polymerase IV [Propionibacteriaceae bacterium]